MYRSFADVVTKKDLDEQARQAGLRPLTPPVEGGKPYNDVMERSEDQARYMEKIIHRMEHLPPNPRVDNPLAITNDARKAGLDYRLIDPEADDYAGSKGNAAVERIYRIWETSAADRGTQLVFCDLSTPRGAFKAVSKPSEPVEPVLEFAADEFFSGAEDDGPDTGQDGELDAGAVEIDDDSGEDTTVAADMDACVAGTSRFSVYDDIKRKLVDKGIPADEIVYIHDADTDVRKSRLFSDMQAGRVRILMGSTAKMGAGMNVQKRLVAAHHLDAPWRPSDLEQRNGRIIRQGNMFYERDPDTFKVGIYYYATKQTYDARMWQTIEYKAAAIEQFRKGDLLQRVIDDVHSEAANAAEMKAAASGNPLILMQVSLAADLRKLEALYAQHQRSQHRLKDRLKWLSSAQERLDQAEASYTENLKRRDEHTHTVTEKGKERIRLEFLVNGRVLREKDQEKIMETLRGGVKAVTREAGGKVRIGSYRGFEVYMLRAGRGTAADGFRFVLKGAGDREFQPDNLIYTFDDKFSVPGFFQRMDNFLDKGLVQAYEKFRADGERELAELETVRAALGQEFTQKDDLALVRENHGAVIRELRRMQNEPGYVSAWTPKTSLGVEQASAVEKPPLTNDDYGQDTAQVVAQALKSEAGRRFGVEGLNRVVFGSVPSSDDGRAHSADTKFAEAGFFAHYAGDGSLRAYKKAPQKTADGGDVVIRIESMGNGAFSVFTQYEKNNIIDARRSYTAAAESADEALAAVANFEQYLLPDTARVAEQAAPVPCVRMR